MIIADRIKKTRRALKRFNAQALIVSNPSNIFYLSGFRGDDSVLLVTPDENYIITDFRFEQEVARIPPDLR